MIDGLEIRESLPTDLASIETLYPDAFPDEDLLPLVRNLLGEESTALSLVAIAERSLAGHVVFTACGFAGSFTACGLAESPDKVALLGPLAVAPARQRQGIGSALVRAGLRRLEKTGTTQVYVLGDPAYYGRFGFEREEGVAPPYPMPEQWHGAWQSIRLRDTATAFQGKLSVPRPWQRPALWAP